MRYFFVLFMIVLCRTSLLAETFVVSLPLEFINAQSRAVSGDTILWTAGTYADYAIKITKNGLTIAAQTAGKTIFNGRARAEINADSVTFSGFQFIGGNIGSGVDLIKVNGSHCVLSQLNVKDYFCKKYLVVDDETQYNTIEYCNFESRTFIGDQNILSILVSENQPGYHIIRWCSFRNFEGEGNGADFGVEPIRIGLSTQALFESRCVVEYCYFTQCNGDLEIISSKSTQNIYRYNTFEDNPYGELTLRHGSEAVVYGNFFLNGKGGIRIKEGQHHAVYNNYFYQLEDRPIILQNHDADPLDDIYILFNTIINCGSFILDDRPSDPDPPTNVTLVNNLFVDPTDDALFTNPTGTEEWMGNFASGNLGFTAPASGIQDLDPLLIVNSAGFFQLSENSPAIDAAQSFRSIPSIPEINFDSSLMLDIAQNIRVVGSNQLDVGCFEYSSNARLVEPAATSENTGPFYYSDSISTNTLELIDELNFSVFPNPARRKFNLIFDLPKLSQVDIQLFDVNGQLKLTPIQEVSLASGHVDLSVNTEELKAGIYLLQIKVDDQIFIKKLMVIK